jgi:4-amino-4-deoxy-L-arabinose transferase-like glycosyltransferase
MATVDLSVVIPVHNEASNLLPLHAELSTVLDGLGGQSEILFVDDASTDDSALLIRTLAARDPRVRLLRLRQRAGLTAALDAGYRAARGAVVVTLDADLQNDPRDIPRLLAALAEADAATGWRRRRHDPWAKRLVSWVGNRLRRGLIGDEFRDGACTLRALRRRTLERLWLLHGLHRFLPSVLALAGARVVEVPVSHRPRRSGASKFGFWNRVPAALADLLALVWLSARRLEYAVVEELAPGREVARPSPAVVPRRTFPRTAGLLAFWTALALGLVLWGLLSGPGPILATGSADIPVRLREALPARGVLSVWVHWDAPSGAAGWVVLEPASGRWSASGELFWRRRVHPGWNQLTWAELSGWPRDAVPLLRVREGQPHGWTVCVPRVTARHGFTHLSPIRGFLAALALALLLGLGSVPGALRRLRSLDPWAAGVAAAAATALWLRVYTLGSQSLWFDEVLTAIGAQGLDWVLYSPQIFGHPPLQYVVAWLAGGGAAPEAWLRAPSVGAGVATVLALGWLGRRLLGSATGLVAACVLALSPFHIELSQLARPYAFFLLFAVLSLGALVRALAHDRVRDWLAFSAVSALTFYTHYFGAYAFLLHAAYAGGWLVRRRFRGASRPLLAFGGVLVLLAPWSPVLWRLAAAQVGGGSLDGATLWDLLVGVWVGQFLGPGLGGLVGLGLVAAGLAGLRRRPGVLLGFVAWLAAPLGLLWAFQPAHFVAGRHLAFVLPALLLLLAHGVATLARAAQRLAMLGQTRLPASYRMASPLAAALCVLAWSTPGAEALRQYYQERLGNDWRTVAEVLDRLVEPGDTVLATLGAAYPLRYYWRGDVLEITGETLPVVVAAARGERVWVVTLEAWDDASPVVGWLAVGALRVAEVSPSWSVPRVFIHRVRPAGALAPPLRPGRARSG